MPLVYICFFLYLLLVCWFGNISIGIFFFRNLLVLLWFYFYTFVIFHCMKHLFKHKQIFAVIEVLFWLFFVVFLNLYELRITSDWWIEKNCFFFEGYFSTLPKERNKINYWGLFFYFLGLGLLIFNELESFHFFYYFYFYIFIYVYLISSLVR